MLIKLVSYSNLRAQQNVQRHGLKAPTDNTNKPRLCILRAQPTTQTNPEPAKARATQTVPIQRTRRRRCRSRTIIGTVSYTESINGGPA